MLKKAPAVKRFIAFLIDWYLASLFGSIPVIMIQSLQGKDLIISNTLEGLSLGIAWTAGMLALSCHFLYYCVVPYMLKSRNHTGQTLGLMFFASFGYSACSHLKPVLRILLK